MPDLVNALLGAGMLILGQSSERQDLVSTGGSVEAVSIYNTILLFLKNTESTASSLDAVPQECRKPGAWSAWATPFRRLFLRWPAGGSVEAHSPSL